MQVMQGLSGLPRSELDARGAWLDCWFGYCHRVQILDARDLAVYGSLYCCTEYACVNTFREGGRSIWVRMLEKMRF